MLDSDVSHKISEWVRIPDAIRGSLAYLGDLLFSLAGSARQWQYRPWMVVGLLLFILGIIPSRARLSPAPGRPSTRSGRKNKCGRMEVWKQLFSFTSILPHLHTSTPPYLHTFQKGLGFRSRRASRWNGDACRPDRPVSTMQVAGSGDPLVLIHGLSGSSRWWRHNTEPLAERFRVYLIDLIGFGASRGAHPFILGEAAEHLCRWMDRLGLGRAHLTDHSMGGLIATELAVRRPDRVGRLVLVSAAALPLPPFRSAFGLVRAVWRTRLSFLPILFTDALRAGPFTLLKAARRTLPDAELLVLDGGGHVPMWERPEAFNEAALAFLAPGPDAAPAPQPVREDAPP